MTESGKHDQVWWGKFTVEENQAGLWRIGASELRIEHTGRELVLARNSAEESAGDKVSIELPVERIGRFDKSWQVERFGMSRSDGRVVLTPLLADRPVVIRTEVPFHLLPRQDITLFVSTPLWCRIESVSPSSTLQDCPVFRPSDTWFGPVTNEGEYCYANRVYGQLSLENIKFRPFRAITVVALKNRSSDSIPIERLKLPAPNLALYEGDQGRLWTQAMMLEVSQGNSLELNIREKPPAEIKNPKLVSGPRQKVENGILTRAFSHLLS